MASGVPLLRGEPQDTGMWEENLWCSADCGVAIPGSVLFLEQCFPTCPAEQDPGLSPTVTLPGPKFRDANMGQKHETVMKPIFFSTCEF